MKCVIITRRRGIRLTTQENCVRVMESEESALRAYPQIKGYERIEFSPRKKEVRYYSPAAIKWYNNRKIGDSFKIIYLTD